MPSKAKSGGKIDGIVAALMGVGRACLAPETAEPSITWI
jgi:phage terminase large subunit-like protein